MDAVERGKSVLGLSFNFRKFQGFLKTSFSSFTTLVPLEWGGSATGVYIFLTFLPQKWLPDLEQSRSKIAKITKHSTHISFEGIGIVYILKEAAKKVIFLVDGPLSGGGGGKGPATMYKE